MKRLICAIVVATAGTFGLGALTQEPCTITVRPGESIQAAIDAAPEGAVICLEEGTWVESIFISRSVTLRGAGRGVTSIRGTEAFTPVLQIGGAGDVGPAVDLERLAVGRESGSRDISILAINGDIRLAASSVSGGFPGVFSVDATISFQDTVVLGDGWQCSVSSGEGRDGVFSGGIVFRDATGHEFTPRSFLQAPLRVASNHMSPALLAGDTLVMVPWDRQGGMPDSGTVVAFNLLEEVRVSLVEEGSPGDTAGLLGGDYLSIHGRLDLGVGGRPVVSTRALDQLISQAGGQELSIAVHRGGSAWEGRRVVVSVNVPSEARALSDLGVAVESRARTHVLRLVAADGQTVQLTEAGEVLVDGKTPHAFEGKHYARNLPGLARTQFGKEPTVVPPGHLFLLGDNTRDSFDSRFWGFIHRDDIVALLWYIVSPPRRAGPIR